MAQQAARRLEECRVESGERRKKITQRRTGREGNAEKSKMPWRQIQFMNAVNATDRVIVVLIALAQMVVCALFLFMEFGIAYGGGFNPFLTPLLFLGLFSAGLLFSQGLLPRIFAGAWQIIFAITVFQFQTNATTRFETFVAFLASFYLCVTTVIRKRFVARPKSSSEAMR